MSKDKDNETEQNSSPFMLLLKEMKADIIKEMKKTADDFKLKIGELETKLAMLENQLTRRIDKMK